MALRRQGGFFQSFEGTERVPSFPWYGVCWRSEFRYICCPIPFNIPLYYARLLLMWMNYGFMHRPAWLKLAHAQLRRGYQLGYRKGLADGETASETRRPCG
jgi:hypothetical protein